MVRLTAAKKGEAKSTGSGKKKSRITPDSAPLATLSLDRRWTFFSNHFHVLILLDRNPSIVLRDVSHQVGITERAVQRVIASLEAAGYIEREKVGRKNRYRILRNRPLRHPIASHLSIGDLLSLTNR